MSIQLKRIAIDEFKILKDIKVELPNLESIMLIGPNEVGKSTFMQFVNIALGNSDAIPPNAMGLGEVVLDKDGKEYRLTVKMDGGKCKVTVYGPDGLPDDRKATLRGLIGAVDFDIDHFVNLSQTKSGQKEQVEEYKKLLNSEEQAELERLKISVDVKYREREELNRHIKSLKGSVESHELYPQSHILDSFKPVSIQDLLQQRDKVSAHNSLVEKGLAKKEALDKECAEMANKMAALLEAVEQLKAYITANTEATRKAQEWLKDNATQSTAQLDADIASAEETNKKALGAVKLAEDMKRLSEMELQSGEMTANIGSQRQAIQDTITNMQVPVQGLYYDEEGLVYNGCPVTSHNLSTSQMAQLGVMIKVAQNPDAPLLLKSTESWDDERWNAILEFAQRHNLQIIAEYVQRGKKGLVIELFKNEPNPAE